MFANLPPSALNGHQKKACCQKKNVEKLVVEAKQWYIFNEQILSSLYFDQISHFSKKYIFIQV